MIAAALLATLPMFAALSPREAQTRAVLYDSDVRAAVAAQREREASLQTARVAAIPHLVADYAAMPQAASNGVGTVEQRIFTVGAGINVNDLFAAPSSIRVAASDLLAAQRDVDAAKLNAQRTVLTLYFAALQSVAVAQLQTHSVADAQRDLSVARLRVRTGDAPQLDVTRAEVSLAQAQAASYRAQADRADALDALANATRIPPSSLSALSQSSDPPQAVPSADRAVEKAFADRPELQALLQSAQSRLAAVVAARSAALPATTVQAGYATGIDTGIHVAGPQVAAHVDVPIATGVAASVAAARARADAAYAAIDAERRQISLEVAAAVRDAAADDLAATAADRALVAATRALNGVEVGYRAGASSSVDVADARRTYLQAAIDALSARYRQAAARWTIEVLAP